MHFSDLCVEAIKAKDSYREIFLIKQFRYKFRGREQMQAKHTSQMCPKWPLRFPLQLSKISASREASLEHLHLSLLPASSNFYILLYVKDTFFHKYLFTSLSLCSAMFSQAKIIHYLSCQTFHRESNHVYSQTLSRK